MKVIIAGSRSISDYALLCRTMELALNLWIPDWWYALDLNQAAILSGHCPSGVDVLGERWAREQGWKLQLHPADWDRHGKAAGPIRNAAMALECDALVALWDRVSVGTLDVIKRVKAHGKPYAVWFCYTPRVVKPR